VIEDGLSKVGPRETEAGPRDITKLGGSWRLDTADPRASQAPAGISAQANAIALAFDGLADAARLMAINALLAESAARRGDTFVERLQSVAAALDEVRDIYKLAQRVSPERLSPRRRRLPRRR
jgi:hypothetical protein